MATSARTWWPGPRTATALFMALVVALLGAVSGWQMCANCWLLFGWVVLACIVAASLALAGAAMIGGDWLAMRVEGRQALNVGVLMLAMLPLHDLSGWLDLAASYSTLFARADASMRANGPRLAMTSRSPDGPKARGGIVYDPDGVIAPRFRQAVAWREDPVVTTLSGDCIVEHRLVGPWYRWSEDCDAF